MKRLQTQIADANGAVLALVFMIKNDTKQEQTQRKNDLK